MGAPVVISQNGLGVPVKPVESGAPALTVAATGVPVIMSDNGTPFVVEGYDEGGEEEEPEPVNLLEGLTWTAGANTTISEVDGRLRVSRLGGNPRAYKLVTGLTIGATYRLSGGLYIGTSTQVVLRATNDSGLSAGPFTKTWTADVVVDETFVATATQHYVGPIGVSTVNGLYVEIDLDFALYEETA